MSAISATIELSDDMLVHVAALLRQFPKGSTVRVDISDAPSNKSAPSAEEYRLIVEAARREAPAPMWKTTNETLTALREGERE